MRLYQHHEHSHGGGDRDAILLNYAHDHNGHHADELVSLAESLREKGKDAAAGKVEAAIEKFREGPPFIRRKGRFVKSLCLSIPGILFADRLHFQFHVT